MYILDGYNFIHKIPELADKLDVSLDDARRALAGYLDRLAPRLGLKAGDFHIVYDGNTKYDHLGGQPGAIKAEFSRGGASADDKIIELLRERNDPSGITVVSDDNMIANGARAHGVKVMRARELLALAGKRDAGRRSRAAGSVVDDKKVIRNAGRITRQLAEEWEVE
jgi:predicted RNA-binding protein with PIN domain